jgi:hypothetical protein
VFWVADCRTALLNPVLPVAGESITGRTPQQPEHPLHLHHVLDLLPWDQPHRPVDGIQRDAVIHDGLARIPRFGFEVHPDADPLAVDLLGLAVAEQGEVE